MTIDELISALSVIRIGHGNIRVLVHDGSDPSDLCPVKLIEVEPRTVFNWETLEPNVSHNILEVHLLTG